MINVGAIPAAPTKMNIMEGTLYIDNFIDDENLFDDLIKYSTWDESMASRRTASFGVPYNYSGIEYPVIDMTNSLVEICDKIFKHLLWGQNNCLINHYTDGNSRM